MGKPWGKPWFLGFPQSAPGRGVLWRLAILLRGAAACLAGFGVPLLSLCGNPNFMIFHDISWKSFHIWWYLMPVDSCSLKHAMNTSAVAFGKEKLEKSEVQWTWLFVITLGRNWPRFALCNSQPYWVKPILNSMDIQLSGRFRIGLHVWQSNFAEKKTKWGLHKNCTVVFRSMNCSGEWWSTVFNPCEHNQRP